MRRLLIAFVGACSLFAGADAVWWRWAQRQLAAVLEMQMSAARTAGWTISNGTAIVGGWPFAATLTLPDLLMSAVFSDGQGDDRAGNGSNPMTWSTDRLVLAVGLLHPLQLAIDSEGSQRLHLVGWPEIPYTADVFHAVIPLQIGVPPRGFNVHLVNLRAGLPTIDNPDSPGGNTDGMTIRGLDLRVNWTPAAQQNEAAVSAFLSATSVQLPNLFHWSLGPTIASVSAELSLNGPLPRTKGLAVFTSPWATSWRDGGGNLEVSHLSLDWGPLILSGNATVALDEAMQPMGAGVLHITDPQAALAILRDSGAISDRAELAAHAVLALMIHPPVNGAKPAVELPATLQERRVSISGFGVARVPQIVWPKG